MPVSVSQPSKIAVSSSDGGVINISIVASEETKVVSLTTAAANNISIAGAIGAGPAGATGPRVPKAPKAPKGNRDPLVQTVQTALLERRAGPKGNRDPKVRLVLRVRMGLTARMERMAPQTLRAPLRSPTPTLHILAHDDPLSLLAPQLRPS